MYINRPYPVLESNSLLSYFYCLTETLSSTTRYGTGECSHYALLACSTGYGPRMNALLSSKLAALSGILLSLTHLFDCCLWHRPLPGTSPLVLKSISHLTVLIMTSPKSAWHCRWQLARHMSQLVTTGNNIHAILFPSVVLSVYELHADIFCWFYPDRNVLCTVYRCYHHPQRW